MVVVLAESALVHTVISIPSITLFAYFYFMSGLGDGLPSFFVFFFVLINKLVYFCEILSSGELFMIFFEHFDEAVEVVSERLGFADRVVSDAGFGNSFLGF